MSKITSTIALTATFLLGLVLVIPFVLGATPRFGSFAAAPVMAPPAQGPTVMAQVGDSATGRVIAESDHRLILDASCDGSRLIQFVSPYAKDALGRIKCGTTEYDEVHVTQQQ